jgi:hypothetical protein
MRTAEQRKHISILSLSAHHDLNLNLLRGALRSLLCSVGQYDSAVYTYRPNFAQQYSVLENNASPTRCIAALAVQVNISTN